MSAMFQRCFNASPHSTPPPKKHPERFKKCCILIDSGQTNEIMLQLSSVVSHWQKKAFGPMKLKGGKPNIDSSNVP